MKIKLSALEVARDNYMSIADKLINYVEEINGIYRDLLREGSRLVDFSSLRNLSVVLMNLSVDFDEMSLTTDRIIDIYSKTESEIVAGSISWDNAGFAYSMPIFTISRRRGIIIERTRYLSLEQAFFKPRVWQPPVPSAYVNEILSLLKRR